MEKGLSLKRTAYTSLVLHATRPLKNQDCSDASSRGSSNKRMKPVNASEMPALRFAPNEGKTTQPFRASTGKIGWMRSLSEKPGVKFDLVIKDALGRQKFVKRDCGNKDTKEYGELVNLPTLLGEDLQIEVENVRGEGEIHVMLN